MDDKNELLKKEEVDIDFGSGELEEPKEPEWVVEDEPEVIETENLDLSVADSEAIYKDSEEKKEINHRVQSLLEDTMVAQSNRMKLEVQEVLNDEVGYRLSKYEKRRKKRDFREKVGLIIKLGIIAALIMIVLGNSQIRNKITTAIKDVGDMIMDAYNGNEVTSNKLVENLLKEEITPSAITHEEEEEKSTPKEKKNGKKKNN